MDATPGNVQKPSGIRIKTVQLREVWEERHYISYPLPGCDPNLAQMACKWLSLPGICKWLLLPENHCPVEKIKFCFNLAADTAKVVGVAALWDNWCITYCHKVCARGGKALSAPHLNLNPSLGHCKAQDNEVSHPALQLISLEPCPISI